MSNSQPPNVEPRPVNWTPCHRYPAPEHHPPLQPTPQAKEKAVDDAANLHAQRLINCYAREVAMQERALCVRMVKPSAIWPDALFHGGDWQRVLEVDLPRTGVRLCAGVCGVSVTANFEYTTPIYRQCHGHGWQCVGWQEVAGCVISELSQRHGNEFNDDLMTQVGESVSTLARIQAQGSTDTLQFGATPNAEAAYLLSEQNMRTGHPFHPAPKSRSGWTADEERRYSPEFRAAFQLHYFAVARERVVQAAVDSPTADALLAKITGMPSTASEIFLPVHPWQANWLRRQPFVGKALAAGWLRDLGEGGPHFHATASIRTLLAEGADHFLKLSLNARITNCIRNNALHELERALAATRLYRAVAPEMGRCFPHFHVLEEVGFLTILPTDATDAAQRETADGFGLLLRQSLRPQLPAESMPVVCGAVFGNAADGRRFALAAIERFAAARNLPIEEGMLSWFGAYAEALFFPLAYLLFEHGLVFEPHMQNLIAVFAGDGQPVQVFLRDLELTRRVENGAHADSDYRHLPCSAEFGWTRLAYCLLVNHLCEAISTLSQGDPDRHLRLWGVLRYVLQSYLERHPSPEAARRIRGLLAGEPLPLKGNLLTRFLRQPDRQARYLPLNHPLGVIDSIHPADFPKIHL